MKTSSLNKPLQDHGPLSRLALKLGIPNFFESMNYVKHLPYGRNANRSDLSLALSEQKGSCSSKHAFLKGLAQEQGLDSVELVLCIFKMTEKNTKGIGTHIADSGLEYMPEAHCFLRIEGKAIDLTNSAANIDNINADILVEEEIVPEQVNQYKIDFHQNFMKAWIQEEGITLSFNEVWQVREKCIASLSNKKTT